MKQNSYHQQYLDMFYYFPTKADDPHNSASAAWA